MPDARHRCQYDPGGGRCLRNRNGASRWCDHHDLSGDAGATLRVVGENRAPSVPAWIVGERLERQGYRRPRRVVQAALDELVARGLLDLVGVDRYRRTELQPIVAELPVVHWVRHGNVTYVGSTEWLATTPARRIPFDQQEARP